MTAREVLFLRLGFVLGLLTPVAILFLGRWLVERRKIRRYRNDSEFV